jgi:urease accessory protein
MQHKRNISVIALMLAMIPGQAFAHHAERMSGNPFLQGVSMPIHSLDHLLLALAVGLLAVQLGGKALWAVPGSFSLLMVAGGLLNIAGISTPLLEQCIFASVLVMGAVLAVRPQWPLLLSLGMVGLGAFFHGEALLAEKPANWSYALFVAGCLGSALLVQATGMALGLALQRFAPKIAFRYAGAAVLVGAVVIYLFPAANNVIVRFIE